MRDARNDSVSATISFAFTPPPSWRFHQFIALSASLKTLQTERAH
jgi:hypothetical protein